MFFFVSTEASGGQSEDVAEGDYFTVNKDHEIVATNAGVVDEEIIR